MIGKNLTKALEWFDRAVVKEEEGKVPLMSRCIDKMVEYEEKGLAAGESW